jgi:hypothetical protein
MLLAGIQAKFGLDPRLIHSGVTSWEKSPEGLLILRSLLRGDLLRSGMLSRFGGYLDKVDFET